MRDVLEFWIQCRCSKWPPSESKHCRSRRTAARVYTFFLGHSVVAYAWPKSFSSVKCDVLTSLTTTVTIFWDMTLYSLLPVYRGSRGTFFLCLKVMENCPLIPEEARWFPAWTAGFLTLIMEIRVLSSSTT